MADLIDKHWHSTRVYDLMLHGMTDEWIMTQDNEPLCLVPVEHGKNLYVPSPRVVKEGNNSRPCRKWTECVNKE